MVFPVHDYRMNDEPTFHIGKHVVVGTFCGQMGGSHPCIDFSRRCVVTACQLLLQRARS